MSGRRARLLAIAGALLAIMAAHPRGRQATTTGFATVSVRVGVERPDGTPVTGLAREDFDVLVDGAPQAISALSAADAPASVVLLIDVSASMNMGDVASGLVLQRALEQWLPLSLKRGDRARVGSFARRLVLSERFTSDKHDLVVAGFAARTVPAADRIGPSPIWDAVDTAVEKLEWESGRRAILLLTDGRATGNRISLKDAGAHAAASTAEVHVIAERDLPISIPQVDGNQMRVTPGVGLRWLADSTGGSYAADKRFPWSDPGPLFAQAVNRLHQGYTLEFVPGTLDGRLHTLDIKVRTPGLNVRARKQFLAAR